MNQSSKQTVHNVLYYYWNQKKLSSVLPVLVNACLRPKQPRAPRNYLVLKALSHAVSAVFTPWGSQEVTDKGSPTLVFFRALRTEGRCCLFSLTDRSPGLTSPGLSSSAVHVTANAMLPGTVPFSGQHRESEGPAAGCQGTLGSKHSAVSREATTTHTRACTATVWEQKS